MRTILVFVLLLFSAAPAQPVHVPDRAAGLDLPEGARPAVAPLVRSEKTSTVLIYVREPVPPHFHRERDELVYILDGGGVFQLEDQRYSVKAGDLLLIPTGKVHAFYPEVPTRALSTFTPAFDGKDRHFIQSVEKPGDGK